MDAILTNLNPHQVATFGLMWNMLPLLGTILVHLAFSAAVFNDANRQRQSNSLTFVSPWLWCLAVLVGGVFVALAYWVIHHSTLVKR